MSEAFSMLLLGSIIFLLIQVGRIKNTQTDLNDRVNSAALRLSALIEHGPPDVADMAASVLARLENREVNGWMPDGRSRHIRYKLGQG